VEKLLVGIVEMLWMETEEETKEKGRIERGMRDGAVGNSSGKENRTENERYMNIADDSKRRHT
jgi:hypothetical protein